MPRIGLLGRFSLLVTASLGDMGVSLSIDDFGVGYSSLSYLKRMPVDEINIDRSFVAQMADDEDDAFIVRSTIDLGRNLGLNVVAEGVEAEAVWDELARVAKHVTKPSRNRDAPVTSRG